MKTSPLSERNTKYFRLCLQVPKRLIKASSKAASAALAFPLFESLHPTISRSVSTPFLPKILDKSAVLELDSLPEAGKTFLIEMLLLWLHHYRLQQENREKLKHAIVIEEAHHVLLRRKQELEGRETVVEVLCREIRELGESLLIVDQHPSLVSRPALGNTYTTICLNLKEASDVRAAADAMLLKEEQREYLGHLPTGQGIVKLQDRWTRPFLVRFPLVLLKKGRVSDKEVRRVFLGCFRGIEDVRPRKLHSSEVSPPDTRECIRNNEFGESRKFSQTLEDTKELDLVLSQDEMEMLRDIGKYPFAGIRERYGRMKLTPTRGQLLRTSLMKKGLIDEINISTGRSRKRILLFTPKGSRVLAKNGIKAVIGRLKTVHFGSL